MTSEEKQPSLAAMTSEVDYNDEEDFDDEAEFSPSEDDSEENDDIGSQKEEEEKYAILTGSLCFNDEGRLVYSGTWVMSDQVENNSPKDSEELPKSSGEKKKKKNKFKLKSKQIVHTDNKKIFNLSEPLTVIGKNKTHNHRTMLFDGFFFIPNEGEGTENHSSKKVKERDVEISFFPSDEKEEGTEKATINSSNCMSKTFKVKGRGFNEYGGFTLEGTYKVSQPKESSDSQENPSVIITCDKRYSVEKSSNGHKRKRSGSYDDESDEDDVYHADEAADYDEIIALNEEAEMSVEELRKRYLSAGATDERKVSPANKKPKTDDLSDDDEYGF